MGVNCQYTYHICLFWAFVFQTVILSRRHEHFDHISVALYWYVSPLTDEIWRTIRLGFITPKPCVNQFTSYSKSTLNVWCAVVSRTMHHYIWAPSSEFVSSSIPSWQIVTAHAQPFRGARDLAFCLKVPLDSLLVWASSGGSGETARMRRLAWTFAARIGDKNQIRLARPIC